MGYTTVYRTGGGELMAVCKQISSLGYALGLSPFTAMTLCYSYNSYH